MNQDIGSYALNWKCGAGIEAEGEQQTFSSLNILMLALLKDAISNLLMQTDHLKTTFTELSKNKCISFPQKKY